MSSTSLAQKGLVVLASKGKYGTIAAGCQSSVMDNCHLDRATATLTVGTTIAFLLIIGPRLQAVFMLTTSTLILRTRVMPNWLAYVGYATGILLFLFPIVAQPVGALSRSGCWS